jgi:serine/arginine repetitive matrix protein 2
MWDDENGIIQLRRYYTLREEAEDTVTHSKRVWLDTPFSIYALQCKPFYTFKSLLSMLTKLSAFVPPRHPAGMQALLQHSLENLRPSSF